MPTGRSPVGEPATGRPRADMAGRRREMNSRTLRRTITPLLTATVFMATALIAVLSSNGARAAGSGGEFFTHCAEVKQKQVDPIVAPGLASAHMHEFFGNTSTDANSTFASMQGAGSTCSLADDTAGYWVPTLIAPNGATVVADSANAYYRSGTFSHVEAFPPDLRMVAKGHYFYSCGNTGSGSPIPVDCGQKYVHASVVFPQCWNGQAVDSADHISHMTYDTVHHCGGVGVPRLTLVVRYPVHDARGYGLSSDAGSGVTDGRSMHADFWNTWQQAELQAEIDVCINAGRKCHQVT
jgi:hypothetical protein